MPHIEQGDPGGINHFRLNLVQSSYSMHIRCKHKRAKEPGVVIRIIEILCLESLHLADTAEESEDSSVEGKPSVHFNQKICHIS